MHHLLAGRGGEVFAGRGVHLAKAQQHSASGCCRSSMASLVGDRCVFPFHNTASYTPLGSICSGSTRATYWTGNVVELCLSATNEAVRCSLLTLAVRWSVSGLRHRMGRYRAVAFGGPQDQASGLMTGTVRTSVRHRWLLLTEYTISFGGLARLLKLISFATASGG
ncbi:hypothetical protein L209DRAFT_105972 [Thermothelomyces heterothallicus CBS 203.75]